MKMIGFIIAGIVVVAVAGWWIYQQVTATDRLIKEALRGEISGVEEGLANNHEQLKSKAAAAIGRLEPGDHAQRESFANLLTGMRYHQLVKQHDNFVQQQVFYTLTEPDPDIVDLLIKLYMDELAATSNASDADSYERLLGVAIRAGKADFLTTEAFTRRCWEQVPGPAKHPLVDNISGLLSMATTSAEESADEFSGWYEVSDEERQQRQQQMMDKLQEWAIPALVAAANGDGVPPEDVGMYRHTALSFGLDIEER